MCETGKGAGPLAIYPQRDRSRGADILESGTLSWTVILPVVLSFRSPSRKWPVAQGIVRIMAAALCRRFFSAVRVSGVLQAPPGACLSGLTSNLLHKNTTKVEPLYQCKFLHTTLSRRGLEEFFDDPKNWGETVVKSGDEWHAKHLRNKSNEDLHKLWYVLLKEKNMLLTLEQEAKRQRLPMPSPERLEKVEKSMGRIDLVIKEREVALRLLQTGHENPRPGEWRNDFLGRTYWYGKEDYCSICAEL
ncbi:ubiquitin thioesterase OTU1 [Platysternon megacephalum]|uniref:Large ribosomal subunit protein uL29m n=1 Tax=Platysternon megacephalum TaxID=55544 RepID=A0A4D9E428_9SAUR|nr:ubiquitin thioesterase OTU1 [Platysternon megacephalum]